MSSVRRAVAMLVTAIVVAAGLGTTPALAAEPDPPCEWEPGRSGTHSTCDGRPAEVAQYECGDTAQLPYQAWVRGPGGVTLAGVSLYYYRGTRTSAYPSGICRLAYAVLTVANESARCYAKVERNSDRQAYRTEYGGWGVYFTQVVYDAGVTSYAWAYCQYNGNAYTAGTPSY